MPNDNHNLISSGVIQTNTDNARQHNNNDNINNNHLNDAIKTENQSSPSSNLVVDDPDSSR